MTERALDLTQRQIRAIAEGAKKAGCVAEVQIGKALVRLIPECLEHKDAAASFIDAMAATGAADLLTKPPPHIDLGRRQRDGRANGRIWEPDFPARRC